LVETRDLPKASKQAGLPYLTYLTLASFAFAYPYLGGN